MMRIIVSRVVCKDGATIGIVYLDGRFNCFSLEDPYQQIKVPGETRIPAGTYRVGVKKHGGLHARYAKRYGSMHKGMLHVLDVVGFTDILVHTGTTARDTAGCLLVGNSHTQREGMKLRGSRTAYKHLYPLVIDAALSGELEIEYRDDDRQGL